MLLIFQIIDVIETICDMFEVLFKFGRRPDGKRPWGRAMLHLALGVAVMGGTAASIIYWREVITLSVYLSYGILIVAAVALFAYLVKRSFTKQSEQNVEPEGKPVSAISTEADGKNISANLLGFALRAGCTVLRFIVRICLRIVRWPFRKLYTTYRAS